MQSANENKHRQAKTLVPIILCFHADGSGAEYDEETELFEQECGGFMKDFVSKIFQVE